MDDVGDVPLGYTRAVAFSIDLAVLPVHVYISNYTRIATIRYRYIYVAGMHGYACRRVFLYLLHYAMHACSTYIRTYMYTHVYVYACMYI